MFYTIDEIEDTATRIRESDAWVVEDCRIICDAAGLLEVFESADGESFERVVIDAANALGVEVIGD